MPKENIENSSNSELIRELVETLKREASLFESFLELLEQQQQALIENNLNALKETTERQRERVIESGILARKRELLTRQLAEEQNITGDVTVSRLMELVLPGQATTLELLRDTIIDLNGKIMKIRSQNELLINHSRETIMKTMELLGRFKSPSGNYQGKGKMESSQTTLALDRRA
nr:flagellar protein FlgN [candidate division Zixibacteria bacterium]